MRKTLLLAAMATLLCVAAGPAFAAKPLAVLSLASQNELQADTSLISKFADAPELPTWLSAELKVYAEGGDLRGLDRSRPWGVVVQLCDKLGAYGFVPVTDAEQLALDLDEHIQSNTEMGDGIYEVIGTEPGKKLFCKVTDKWIFISDCPETLKTVPADPTELIDGLNAKYDVAVRLQLQNVPADHGRNILAALDEKLGGALRRVLSDGTVQMLGEAAFVLEEVTLGWAER